MLPFTLACLSPRDRSLLSLGTSLRRKCGSIQILRLVVDDAAIDGLARERDWWRRPTSITYQHSDQAFECSPMIVWAPLSFFRDETNR